MQCFDVRKSKFFVAYFYAYFKILVIISDILECF